jgi:hypothetical protein
MASYYNYDEYDRRTISRGPPEWSGLTWWFRIDPDNPSLWKFRRSDTREITILPHATEKCLRSAGFPTEPKWIFKGDHGDLRTWAFTVSDLVILVAQREQKFLEQEFPDSVPLLLQEEVEEEAMDLFYDGWHYVEDSYMPYPYPAHPDQRTEARCYESPGSSYSSSSVPQSAPESRRHGSATFQEIRPSDLPPLPHVETILREPRPHKSVRVQVKAHHNPVTTSGLIVINKTKKGKVFLSRSKHRR